MVSTHNFTDDELLLVLEGLRRIKNNTQNEKLKRTKASMLYSRLMDDRNWQAEKSGEAKSMHREMTVEELYDWAVIHSVENRPLYVSYRDSGGSYEGYDNDLEPVASTVDGVDAVMI